jgi:hypothetical protein
MHTQDASDCFPEEFVRDFRIESAQRAIAAYRRAAVLRRLAVGAILVLATLRVVWLYVAGPGDQTVFNSPFVWGLTLLASFVTFTLEWSTNARCKEALARCDMHPGAGG